jgi:hypothetical protein
MPMSPKGAAMKKSLSKFGRVAAVAIPVALFGSAVLIAQIEGPKRGIAPIASTGDFEVEGVEVVGKGENADEARQDGWEQAQRLAWEKLWARNKGGAIKGGGGQISDSTLNGIVSAIVIEEEQIGPRRYVAKLGVVFDRARAGQLLGVRGVSRRSAPLMILPVMWDGGAPVVYEQRSPWQNAWAKFRTSESQIDYVRPSGAGGESLLLNGGQIDRRSRTWWRTILDQFGAADVIIPIVKLERKWPGGPVLGRFSARYGPDNKFLGSFTLQAADSKGIPAMMAQGVKKMDELFQSALAGGRLRSDASLIMESQVIEEEDLDTEAPTPAPAVTSDTSATPVLDVESIDVLDRAVDEVTAEQEGRPVTPPTAPTTRPPTTRPPATPEARPSNRPPAGQQPPAQPGGSR